jgi:hypothetical protein
VHSEVLNVVNCVMLCRSMTRAEVTDEVHDLQIWSVAANVLNEQVRTAEKGWVSSKIG